MVEASSVTDPQHRGPWQFTLRSLFSLTFSVAVGLSFWKMSQDWYGGVLAAISFWIVLGLTAQIRDIWSSSRRRDISSPEDRWGRRFAIFWRLVLCGALAACFALPLLVTFHIVALNDGLDFVAVTSRDMWRAVLLISIIVAVASSPRFKRPARRRRWSWAVGMFGGIAGLVLFAVLLYERLCISFLVHVTIGGILSAAPLWCARDAVATYSPARAARFLDITTVGVIAILVSCGLLRLLSLRWRQTAWQRICLGVLLAASLAGMFLLTARIALVEVPGVTPVLAANIPVPALSRLAPAVLLVLLLTTVIAGRWSKMPLGGVAPDGLAWRRDEHHYYHERLLLMLLLGGVALAECVVVASKMYYFPGLSWYQFGYLITDTTGALSAALVLLAVQGVISRWSKRPDAVAMEPLRLSPGLFLLLWTALLAIVLCSAPIFAAWGFALWLK